MDASPQTINTFLNISGYRVKVERDQRLVNASTLTIEREDHTIGNLLRM